MRSALMLLVLLGSFISLTAQVYDPVKWSFHAEITEERKATLFFTATIEDTWHLYSQDIPQGGPIPISFRFNPSGDYKLSGKVIEKSEVETAYDPNFNMKLKWFSHKAVFSQKVAWQKDPPAYVTGMLEFMTCNDKMCLPPKEVGFTFNLTKNSLSSPEGEDTGNVASDRWYTMFEIAKKIPEYDTVARSYEPKSDAIGFLKHIAQPVEIEVFFGDWCGDSREHVPPLIKILDRAQNSRINARFINVDREKKEPAALLANRGVHLVPTFIFYTKGKEIGRIVETPFGTMENHITSILQNLPQTEKLLRDEDDLPSQENGSLWAFFLIAFLGGLAALLTPCVFPMIPITVSYFLRSSTNRFRSLLNASLYGLFIVIIYTLAGTVVAFAFGAHFANWLSTHWLPNLLFFLVFLLFAVSFLGMFEINLPSRMVNKADKQADRGGLTGIFFMALTLVLVSFACTGPIVGALLVDAAGGHFLKPIVGMLGFSLAFAFPFSLFAAFPSWLGGLPKSGGWMNSVKVVLGFIVLALSLKFLSIPDQTYHWGILNREIFIALWIVICLLLGLYLLGKLKLSHDADLSSISVPRLLLALITFTFMFYLLTGLFGAPLRALAGFLPPQTYQVSDLSSSNASLSPSSLCEEPRFAGFLHLPLGLKGYFDYEQGLSCAKTLNKPLLLDFNGHGCANCKKMEAKVWSDPQVLERLRSDFIIVSLYVDDKTELPDGEWSTSSYDGKTIKTIGRKNADLQISRFNVNAQPYYVLIDHNEKPLTKPIGLELNVEKFLAFLNNGLIEFQKGKTNLTGNQ